MMSGTVGEENRPPCCSTTFVKEVAKTRLLHGALGTANFGVLDVDEVPAAKGLYSDVTAKAKHPLLDGSFEYEIRAAIGAQDLRDRTI